MCSQNDAAIFNEDGVRILYDCDGERLFAFPAEWTDAQIFHALDFANIAYERGTRHGKSDKAAEIRKALGFEA